MADRDSIRKEDWDEECVSDVRSPISFAPDLERGRPLEKLRNASRTRSLSRIRSSDRPLFPKKDRVSPDKVLPAIYKTISHRVDTDIDEGSNAKNASSKFSSFTFHTRLALLIGDELNTSLETGLSDAEYAAKLKLHGPNVQSKPPSRLLHKLFVYFFGGFGSLLLTAGILCIVCWKPLGEPAPQIANLVLGLILIAIFLLQALFNWFQDFSSSRVMDSIHDMIPLETMITRNGSSVSTESKNLVPGDIVHLTAGSKVPADLRIVEASADLAFDRSILTGESKPIAGSANADPQNSNYLESTCIAMQGTYIVSGSGLGLVVSTGDETIFGTIAKLTSAPKKGLSPLQWEILRFVLFTSTIIVILSVLVIVVWAAWLRKVHHDWITVPALIISIVSVAVSFIPEGLPVALTTCLIITANQMRRNKIMCKSLSVVETLGAVSVLCFDKTGTLTKNAMSVTDVCQGLDTLSLKDSEEKSEFANRTNPLTNHFLTISSLCNDAMYSDDGQILGNATDKAVFEHVSRIQPRETFATDWESLFAISFNSKNKYMAKLLKPRESSTADGMWRRVGLDIPRNATKTSALLTVKGAPDILLRNCEYILKPQATGFSKTQLDTETRQNLATIQQEWSKKGKRVILLASKIISTDSIDTSKSADTITTLRSEITGGLTFIGMYGIEDPPRKNIDQVMYKLRQAGIKTVMITGDFELTGLSIAKQVGIVTEEVDEYKDLVAQDLVEEHTAKVPQVIEKAVSITGPDINKLTDTQWSVLVRYKELVFTRTTPEHKLLIIKQFQKHKVIIGMTGDGINDSPSLKQADVGISLINASDIAKEASDLILMDDGDSEDALFNSIIEALRFGRLLFQNLKKTVGYLLPAGTFSELWPVLLNVLCGMPQMLSSFLMIVISCITDCSNAIILAYEEGEKNLLLKPPRSVTKEKLVDTKLLFHSYLTVGAFYSFTSFLLGFINLKRSGFSFSDFSLSYGTYLSLPHVNDAINTSSSIYFNNLVIMQCFNLLAMRTRYLSIAQHTPLKNKYLFFTIPFTIAVTFFVNYIPAINSAMGTARVPVEYYFISLGFGLMVLCYDELRKWYVRKYPNGHVARLAW